MGHRRLPPKNLPTVSQLAFASRGFVCNLSGMTALKTITGGQPVSRGDYSMKWVVTTALAALTVMGCSTRAVVETNSWDPTHSYRLTEVEHTLNHIIDFSDSLITSVSCKPKLQHEVQTELGVFQIRAKNLLDKAQQSKAAGETRWWSFGPDTGIHYDAFVNLWTEMDNWVSSHAEALDDGAKSCGEQSL